MKSFIVIFIVIHQIFGDLNLLILHTNDMHARFDQTSPSSGNCKREDRNRTCLGGFARVAHIVKEYRNAAEEGKEPSVLFLNAGDTFTGSPWFTVHKWNITVALLNQLRPDVISFGNHEFDYGISGIMPFLENYKYPLVTANIDSSKEKEFNYNLNKSIVLEVKGKKIGVIGYLTPDTKVIASPGNLILTDEVKAIKKEVERLKSEGVNIFIALGHSGFKTDQKIASEIPDIDIVVGGHTNTFLWNGQEPSYEKAEGPYPFVVTQKSGKKVPVVQAYAYTKYVGKLYTTFNDDGDLISFEGNPIFVNASVPQDEEMLNILEPYRNDVEKLFYKEIGYSRVDLDASQCRMRECNFGNMVADAWVEYKVSQYKGNYWVDTPISIVNGGTIRATIDAGKLTYGDFMGATPFQLPLISFNLKGSDLKKVFETSIRSNGETSRGEFLQVSGVKVKYDVSKPVGDRVVSLELRCAHCKVPTYQPLDLNKEYSIVANDYIVRGGDSYTVLKDSAYNKREEIITDMEAINWYVEKHGVVFPDEDLGRIVFEGKEATASSSKVLLSSISLIVSFSILIQIY